MMLRALLMASVIAVSSGQSLAQTASAPAPYAGDDSEAEPPLTTDDLAVVARARELLSSPLVWNRRDTRECPKDETRHSLYCALEIATLEVEGAFSHRGAAMQQARFVVDEITSKRDYQHRLKDYNNDPTTTFSDVERVFHLVEARIRSKLAAESRLQRPPK